MATSAAAGGGAGAAEWAPTATPHDASTRAGFHVGYAIKDGEFGQGLYATHFIPAGTLMWKYQSGARGAANVNVWSYTTEEEARARLAEATPEQAAYIMDHVYMFDGRLNEITDDGKLWNHSETPNTGLPPKGEQYCFESTYSIKDIQAGEEFLDDYGIYEYSEWYTRLCKEHGVTRDFVVKKAAPKKE